MKYHYQRQQYYYNRLLNEEAASSDETDSGPYPEIDIDSNYKTTENNDGQLSTPTTASKPLNKITETNFWSNNKAFFEKINIKDLFTTNDDNEYWLQWTGQGFQKDNKSRVAGGNLVKKIAGDKFVPASYEEFEYIVELVHTRLVYIEENYHIKEEIRFKTEMKKPKKNRKIYLGYSIGKHNDYIVFKTFLGDFLIRMTGGGARGEVYCPSTDDHIDGIRSGVAATTVTYIEELMTAVLFNYADKNSDVAALTSILSGTDSKKSDAFYAEVVSILSDENNSKTASELVKRFNIGGGDDDNSSAEEKANIIFDAIGKDWMTAIANVVACMLKKIDIVLTDELKLNVSNSIKDDMTCYHPKQLNTFNVDQYTDPSDIVLLNNSYKKEGTLTYDTKNIKKRYSETSNEKIDNTFIDSSLIPFAEHKAIGISLKKPSKDAAAHYVGSIKVEQSAHVKVTFNGNNINTSASNVFGISFIRICAPRKGSEPVSAEIHLNIRKDLADKIGIDTTGYKEDDSVVEAVISVRNKNKKSSKLVTFEVVGVGDARGGGFGGSRLYELFMPAANGDKTWNNYDTGPKFLDAVFDLKNYKDNGKIKDGNITDLETLKNKDILAKVFEAFARSLKIPFINNTTGFETIIPSYVKIS